MPLCTYDRKGKKLLFCCALTFIAKQGIIVAVTLEFKWFTPLFSELCILVI